MWEISRLWEDKLNTDLLRKIGPQTLAIVWMTEEVLGPDCPHYATFHYLFDGVLTEKKKREMSFFEGNHYGHKLFLLHTSQGEASDHLKQFHNLIHNYRSEQFRQMLFVADKLPVPIKDLIHGRFKTEYDIAVF